MFNSEHSHQMTGHVQFNKRTGGGADNFLVRICGRVNQERFLVNNNFSLWLSMGVQIPINLSRLSIIVA